MIIEAATLVMRWNIFVYEDAYFRQLVGTAMGTQAAELWDIIYYHWQKKLLILVMTM